MRFMGGLEVRFELVQLPTMDTPCRVWTGSRNNRGYGRQWVRELKRIEYVHRIAWSAAHGPIPAGREILHTCDNPPCYELEHLSLGTHLANSLDMVAKRRQWKQAVTHCPRGHAYDEANTHIRMKRTATGLLRPVRVCRACWGQGGTRNF